MSDTDTTTIREKDGIILEMTRRFKAPRERVFDAWSSVEALTHWFGPATCAVRGGEVDFRVGGRYRLDLNVEGMGEIAIGGVYREISRPEKLGFSWKWSEHEELCDAEMEVVIAFSDAGDGETELRLTQTGFPEREVAEHHGQGWGGSFEKLRPWVEAV